MDMTEDRLAPYYPEAEAALIGSILIDPDVYVEVEAAVTAADFYVTRNRYTWEAIVALVERRIAVDAVTVIEELRDRGRLGDVTEGGVIEYVNTAITSMHAESYAAMIHEAGVRRRLVGKAGEIAKLAYNGDLALTDVVAAAERELLALTSRSGERPLRSAYDALMAGIEETERRRDLGGALSGITTGLEKLDEMIDGLNRTEVIYVAGRPGAGKTALLDTFIVNQLRLDDPPRALFFPLEMHPDHVARRFITMETGIPYQRLRRGSITDAEHVKFLKASAMFAEMARDRLFFDAYSSTIRDITSRCRRHLMTNGLDIVYIDYAQLINPDRGARYENRAAAMTAVSQGLKTLARELDICVVAAVQLKREVDNRPDNRPTLSDLKDSGSFEQDADIVIGLYREAMYNPDLADRSEPSAAEALVLKNRNGEPGKVPLIFQPVHMRYIEAQEISLNF